MKLQEMPLLMGICRLSPNSPIPSWAIESDNFFSITKTTEELSIVIEQSVIPLEEKTSRNWKIFKFVGTLDFSLTGILASAANPLGKNNISIFAISSYDTDFILVKEQDWDRAKRVLMDEGFTFV